MCIYLRFSHLSAKVWSSLFFLSARDWLLPYDLILGFIKATPSSLASLSYMLEIKRYTRVDNDKAIYLSCRNDRCSEIK